MTAMTGAGPAQSQEPLPKVSHVAVGAQGLGLFFLPSQVHQQEIGSEVEQRRLTPAPTANADTASRGLRYYAMTLAHKSYLFEIE